MPRVARLMALALHFDRLLGAGAVKNYAALARRDHVTRARITQIMNLLQARQLAAGSPRPARLVTPRS